MADIKQGVIEANGELGYELTEAATPVTKRDLELWLTQIGVKKGSR